MTEQSSHDPANRQGGMKSAEPQGLINLANVGQDFMTLTDNAFLQHKVAGGYAQTWIGRDTHILYFMNH